MHEWLSWLPLRWLVFLHVLSAFAFLLVHGPSIAAMLMLRREREPGAVRALLDMSRHASGWMWAAWSLLALTGALLASVQHAWRSTWVWGSVVVLVVVTGAMSPLAANAFNQARSAAGLPWFDGRRIHPAGPPDPAAVEKALATVRARTPFTVALGVAGAVALVWLMTYKPA